MTLSISSGFDSGNIRVLAVHRDTADLEIIRDRDSDFYQWFHFRVSGAAGHRITLRILNCGGPAYPHAWQNYSARVSEDRENWTRPNRKTLVMGKSGSVRVDTVGAR